MNSSARGFTLIEIMIVVGLLVILTGALLPSFSQYVDKQNLVQGIEQVKNDLRTVQNRALTNAQYAGSATPVQFWGIRFTNNSNQYSYVVSYSTSPSCSSVTQVADSTNRLPENTTIAYSTSGDRCVFFDVDNGGTPEAGTIYIYAKRTGLTLCKRVEINNAGLITVPTSEFTCP